MTESELSKAMIMANGGSPFVKLARVAEWVGDKNTQRVKTRYLYGLEKIAGKYFIPEVAKRLKKSGVPT